MAATFGNCATPGSCHTAIMPRNLSCLFVALSLGLLPANAEQPAAAAATTDQTNADHFREPLAYYKYYLESCREQDIRCLWFLNDNIKVGMVMALNLRQSQVKTFRHVFAWAMQDEEERKLSHTQTTALESLLPQLPQAPEVKTEFAQGLHIAFWKAGKPCLISYPKHAVPRLVQRLYDIGGGSPGFTYAE